MERNQLFKFYLGERKLAKGTADTQSKDSSGVVNLHNFFLQKGFNPRIKSEIASGSQSPISFAKHAVKELTLGGQYQPQINIINIKNLNYMPSKTFEDSKISMQAGKETNDRLSKLDKLFGRGKSCQVGNRSKTFSREDSVLQRSVLSSSQRKKIARTRTQEHSRTSSVNPQKRKASIAFDKKLVGVIAQINEKLGSNKEMRGRLFQKLVKISKGPGEVNKPIPAESLVDSAFGQVSLFISQRHKELQQSSMLLAANRPKPPKTSSRSRSRSTKSKQGREKSLYMFRDSSSDLNNVTMSNLNVNQGEDTKGSKYEHYQADVISKINFEFKNSYDRVTRKLVCTLEQAKPKSEIWSKRTSSESTQTDRDHSKPIGLSSLNIHNLMREYGEEKLADKAKTKQIRPVLAKKMQTEGKISTNLMSNLGISRPSSGDSQTRALCKEVFASVQTIAVYEESLKILRDMGFDLEDLASRGYARLVPPMLRTSESQALEEDDVPLELQVSGASLASNYTREVAEARSESLTGKQKNIFHLDFRKLDTTVNESVNDIDHELNG